ncbi:hypothetical protein Nepgr_030641 [Nepenthes gracilis]|uniref:Uncharacterized protein n=1 Tax=Nepenthes gracilis TaxID=150966 RepID=A0AAD3Y4F8_NEPGR|nr:hypothetical protein Nepgr_030641 [Nepenthes gracilis]
MSSINTIDALVELLSLISIENGNGWKSPFSIIKVLFHCALCSNPNMDDEFGLLDMKRRTNTRSLNELALLLR